MANANLEITQKSELLTDWLSANASQIPGIHKLIRKLESERKAGHVVHAFMVKRLVEDGTFKITHVEKSTGSHDIDIELDGSINLQVWHGASSAADNMRDKDKSSPLGGVEVDWERDEQNLLAKLRQLPEDAPGFLVCYDYRTGLHILPEWRASFPENKALLELYYVRDDTGLFNESRLHCSGVFKHDELAHRISNSLGFHLKG